MYALKYKDYYLLAHTVDFGIVLAMGNKIWVDKVKIDLPLAEVIEMQSPGKGFYPNNPPIKNLLGWYKLDM